MATAPAVVPYDVAMTPRPPAAPEPAEPTPPVCVCGYDLAGLPPEPDAKCPECGAVRPALASGRTARRRRRVLAGVALAPVVVFAAAFVLWGAPLGRSADAIGLAAATVAAVFSWIVSVPAAIVWFRRRPRADAAGAPQRRAAAALVALVALHALVAAGVLALRVFVWWVVRHE